MRRFKYNTNQIGFYDANTLLADTVLGLQAQLVKALRKYNEYRPHFLLDGLTPIQSIQSISQETAA